ncbi:unnamed protein product [Peniophora sp. CBMAI 1063]|nr:unnamed protein product [Peniophora sp. CBMAI 1063]
MATGEIIDLTKDSSDVEEIKSTDFSRGKSESKAGPSRRERKRKRAAQYMEEHDQPIAIEVKADGDEGEGSTARKSRRKKNKSARSSPAPAAPDSAIPNMDDLFFVDTAPAAIPSDLAFIDSKPSAPSTTSNSTEESALVKTPESPALLLPAHVSVLAENADGKPIEIIRPPSPGSEGEDVEDFIQYLDYDDRPTDLARYFEKPEDEKRRIVCKRCGAEGEHSTGECTLKICMTCGVRGEHTTFGCPISKTCHTCGMKGHLRQNCPNRSKSRQMMDNSYNDCDRCGSSKHQTVECPTHWRMYEYVSEAERTQLLEARGRISELKLGEGGEAYIARDEWCYNCGCAGHLGDDCEETFMEGCPTIPSAFGSYNTMSGPFYDATQPPLSPSTLNRPPREWEDGGDLMDGWGFSAPAQVGQKAKKDKKRKMEKAWQDKQEKDDEDDWFSNPRNARGRGMNGNSGGGGASGSGSGSGAGGAGKKKPMFLPMKTSLIDRIEGGHSAAGSSRQSSDSRNRDRDRDWDRGRDRGGKGGRSRDNSGGGGYQKSPSSYKGSSRDRDREREWDRGKRGGGGGGSRDHDRRDRDRRDDRQYSSGPRYKGGYAH